MRQRLLRIYGFLQPRIAPNATMSQFAYRDILVGFLRRKPRWLDLGCGHQFMPSWAWSPDIELLNSLPRIVGVDGDLASLQQHTLLENKTLADIRVLPFREGSFDLVTANFVMEHVRSPGVLLKEVNRVLAPGGALLLHTPNIASPIVFLASKTPETLKKRLIRYLEGRAAEDIYPTVYEINTRGRVHRLAAEAGLEVEACNMLVTGVVTAVLGPLSIVELLLIRMMRHAALAGVRPEMIAVLRKPAVRPAR